MNPSYQPEEARRELRAWILANAQGLTEQSLTDTTPLFAGRYLSSLHVPELLLTLERLRGRRIDLAGLKAADLRDLSSLCARFLPGENDGGGNGGGAGGRGRSEAAPALAEGSADS